jgi:hypothetical protein
MTHVISVTPTSAGWTVHGDGMAEEMVFTSGGRAEQAARRLAADLVQSGQIVELRIYLRDGSMAVRTMLSV